MPSDTMQDEIDRLTALMAQREADVRALQTEIDCLKSTIRVRDVEIAELTHVIARNLTRVKAETAVAAQQIAMATSPAQRRTDA